MFAGAGIGSASYADTRLLSEALSLNIKIIPGYNGTEGEMAMMRGEICGQVASTSSVQGFVDAGFGSYILAIGGDIGTGQYADAVDQRPALFTLCQVATVEQQIGISIERVTPGRDLTGIAGQRRLVQLGVSQTDVAVAAVTKNVDRVHAR